MYALPGVRVFWISLHHAHAHTRVWTSQDDADELWGGTAEEELLELEKGTTPYSAKSPNADATATAALRRELAQVHAELADSQQRQELMEVRRAFERASGPNATCRPDSLRFSS